MVRHEPGPQRRVPDLAESDETAPWSDDPRLRHPGVRPVPLLGVAAWVMESGDMAQIDAGTMDPDGRGLTQAGKLCGIVGIALNVLVLGVTCFFLFFAMGAAAISAG